MDNLGRVRRQWRPFYSDQPPEEPLTFYEFSYDLLDRPLQITAPDGSVRRWEYALDDERAFDEEGHQHTFRFDTLGRLVQSTPPSPGEPVTYTYGPFNASGSVTTWNTTTQIDANVLGLVHQRDSADAGTTDFRYNAFGELLTVEDAANGVVQYQHDASGESNGLRAARKERALPTTSARMPWGG
jgi:YD repeat-containing protein